MGFLDQLSDSFNRGMDSVNRGTRKLDLKAQLAKVQNDRQSAAAQLGASLYETTRDNVEFTAGREALYEAIAKCDEERVRIEAEIAEIEKEAAAAERLTCHKCGATVNVSDSFCTGCGTPVSEIRQAASEAAAVEVESSAKACPACGSPIYDESAIFCTACGTRIDGVSTQGGEEPAADFEPVGATSYTEIPNEAPAVAGESASADVSSANGAE